jgi:hypothetical protein
MAKDSDRLRGGVDLGETGGALSGLLAEEDEFDRRTLWRLGTWAAVSVGAVVVALVTNQSSIGWRREQTASADLIKQAQLIQLASRENQNESRRLASAIDTLNSDRDRLYSRVSVLEQGLDSVTGAIARQTPASSSPQANSGPTNTSQASASAAPSANPSASAASSASTSVPPPTASMAAAAGTATAPAATTSADAPSAAAKSAPVPVVAPVAATAPAVLEKQDKQASKPPTSSEPSSTAVASAPAQQVASAPAQPSGSLMASKSMMAPPDPAAGKLIAPVGPPKTVTSAPLPEITIVSAKASEQAEPDPAPPPPAVELVARRTEFGVDVGGANSVPGLRALWRGLLKSKSNAALSTLRPIIVIKENNNGLGMQLRLVAGPISDAAAAAKICASLTVNDRGCTTSVFEGQRLVMSADEQAKLDTKPASEAKANAEAKPDSDAKSGAAPNVSGHRHYAPRHSSRDDDPPKQESSTLSRLFSTH